MNSRVQNQYDPNYVSPPGETLLELLKEKGMSQAELARRMGRPKKTINEIIRGKAAITPETALQIERVLGTPASFWNNREQYYRQYLARTEERKHLTSYVGWLKEFPIKAMIDKGWIQPHPDRVQQLHELLQFFGIAFPDQWNEQWSRNAVAYRKTYAFASDQEALAAWLRRGELEAQDISCRPYSAKRFREILNNIRHLTIKPPEEFCPELESLCSEAGVAVVFVPQLPRARVSGATCWLSSDKALIQLSLRYKMDDHLWFTFFHEAGHILLHGKRDVFLEGLDTDDVKEQEANEFAANMLVPQARLKELLDFRWGRIGKRSIQAFANEIGIAPGIVVGRLQHDEVIPFTHCNALKTRFKWAD